MSFHAKFESFDGILFSILSWRAPQYTFLARKDNCARSWTQYKADKASVAVWDEIHQHHKIKIIRHASFGSKFGDFYFLPVKCKNVIAQSLCERSNICRPNSPALLKLCLFSPIGLWYQLCTRMWWNASSAGSLNVYTYISNGDDEKRETHYILPFGFLKTSDISVSVACKCL